MSTPSPELIAVARAIYERHPLQVNFGANPPMFKWDELSPGLQSRWIGDARAALSAIRVPSEGMVEAVAEMDDDGSGEWEPTFTAAIDHILGSTE